MREELKRVLKPGDRLNGHLVLAVRPYTGAADEICQTILVLLDKEAMEYCSAGYNCQTGGNEWFSGHYFHDFLQAAEDFTYRPKEKLEPQVWKIDVHHEYGVNHYFGWTAEAAVRQLDKYVLENWDDLFGENELDVLDMGRWNIDAEYRSDHCERYFNLQGIREAEWYEGPELVEVQG